MSVVRLDIKLHIRLLPYIRYPATRIYLYPYHVACSRERSLSEVRMYINTSGLKVGFLMRAHGLWLNHQMAHYSHLRFKQ